MCSGDVGVLLVSGLEEVAVGGGEAGLEGLGEGVAGGAGDLFRRVDGRAVGDGGVAVAVGEPRFDLVEVLGAEDDGREDGDLGVEGDEGRAAFGDAAAEDGVGSALDAAFGEDADGMAGVGEGDGTAEGLRVDAGAVDLQGAQRREELGERRDVKLGAGEPGDVAAGVKRDEERLEVGDMGDG